MTCGCTSKARAALPDTFTVENEEQASLFSPWIPRGWTVVRTQRGRRVTGYVASSPTWKSNGQPWYLVWRYRADGMYLDVLAVAERGSLVVSGDLRD